MRGDAVGHHDLAHDENAVGAGRIRVKRHRLQHAIGAAAFGLHGRGTIEAPQRQLFERREFGEFLDLRLAAKVGDRGVTIEPNVLELVFRHSSLSLLVHRTPNGLDTRLPSAAGAADP
jgi:hypothetical protein